MILIGEDTALDLRTLIETRLLVQANSGAGKSYFIRRLLEQSHGQVQQIVLDLEGEFKTLREKFDYVLAGKGGDTAAHSKTATVLAQRLMELRVSAIIDLYDLQLQDRKRYVRLFLESLLSTPRELWHPVLVVLDEAHHFCPESGQCESASAVIDLATRGRKRGFCAVLATQRLSKLHKDACAELLNKAVGRTGLDIDQARAGDELGMGKADRLALRNLNPGQFHLFGPALTVGGRKFGGVHTCKVGSIQTTHPKVGSRQIDAPPKPTPAIRSILGKLADLPSEAAEESGQIEKLSTEVANLKRELVRVRRLPTRTSEDDKKIAEMTAQCLAKEKEVKSLREQLTKIAAICSIQIQPVAVKIITTIPAQKPRVTQQTPATVGEVSRPQQRMLDALAMFESLGCDKLHRAMLAVQSDQSPRSSAYKNNLYSLRSSGLVEYQGELVVLTDSGRSTANPPDVPVSLHEFHSSWAKKVSNPQARMLQALIEEYPGVLSRTALAEQSAQSPTSSAYKNNLYALRTLGALDYVDKENVRASDLLFPKGLS